MSEIKSNAEIEPCLTAVMPVYNEAATVNEVIKVVLAQRPVQQLIIVDDCSKDGTWDKLQLFTRNEPRVKLIQHDVNQGKGAALRTGIAHASSRIVIIQDADLEYDPEEYFRLLTPILTGKADVVFGSRFLGGVGAHRVLYFWHSIGNRFLTLCSNMATGLNLTDMETCYKVFRREIIQKIIIEENRFGFEPEITAKVAHSKVRIYEVGISYNGRTYSEGKKSAGAMVSVRCGASPSTISGADEQPAQCQGPDCRFCRWPVSVHALSNFLVGLRQRLFKLHRLDAVGLA